MDLLSNQPFPILVLKFPCLNILHFQSSSINADNPYIKSYLLPSSIMVYVWYCCRWNNVVISNACSFSFHHLCVGLNCFSTENSVADSKMFVRPHNKKTFLLHMVASHLPTVALFLFPFAKKPLLMPVIFFIGQYCLLDTSFIGFFFWYHLENLF